MENKFSDSIAELLVDKKFAIGNDIVFLPDFKASFNNLFKNKVYTENEIAYCDQFDDALLRYASTWAAKEAAYKALKQLDQSTLGWKKIEIIRKKNVGQPQVVIHKDSPAQQISLTISHDGDYVWAIALIENNT